METNILNGKTAVVTGAGGVLCGYFAKALAKAGASVALLDINESDASKTAKEITQNGGNARAYKCDVLDKDVCRIVAKRISDELGACDILINGAGGNSQKATTAEEYFEADSSPDGLNSFFSLDAMAFEAVFKLNFLGVLIPTQVFAKQMLGKSGCSIINISSMNAFTPLTKIPAYSGAKAAVSNFTRWLAVHFSHVGIRVNAIAPGFFSATQNASLLFNDDGTPTTRTKKILSSTPMGRFGNPSELTGSLMFLVNDKASSFITGTILPVDGGFSAYSGV